MGAKLWKAMLEARTRSIRRELENLDLVRFHPVPARHRREDLRLRAEIREREATLLRELERLDALREALELAAPCFRTEPELESEEVL